jgi:hypothetical protein
MRIAFLVMASAVIPAAVSAQPWNVPWSGYAHDPQHRAVSATAAQPLHNIHWRTLVDLVSASNVNPPSNGMGVNVDMDFTIDVNSPEASSAPLILAGPIAFVAWRRLRVC